jgi:P27 family predicted phage terminase small subunit
MSILKKIDREVLCIWVETLDRHNQAQQLLNAETSPQLWLASPCHRIIDRTTTLLIRLASELGFSPASRPRLTTEHTAGKLDDNDPWTALRLIPGGKTPE